MSFKFFTFWPDSMDRPGRASVDQFIQYCDLTALVARTINTQPVLVFCEQTCYQELQSANLNPRLIDDDPDF